MYPSSSTYDEVRDLGGFSKKTANWSLRFLGGGLCVAFFAPFCVASANKWGAGLTSLLSSSACAMAGVLLGFIFGIPKANSKTRQPEGDADRPASRLEINTNLEQISDWLTKIFVGLGLVEARNIVGFLRRGCRFMANAFGDPVRGEVIAAAVIVYFLCLGFLAGYLITRLYFSPLFAKADGAGDFSVKDKNEVNNAKISLVHGTKPKALGETIENVAIETLTLPDHIRTWAKAHLLAEIPDLAVLGYQKLFAKFPSEAKSAQLRLEYATALFKSGKALRVVRKELIEALELTSKRDERAEIMLSLLFVCLYMPPPDGFDFVICEGENYLGEAAPKEKLDEQSAKFRVGICINLACAYAQKAAWQSEVVRGDAERTKEARRMCLKFCSTAIAIDEDPKRPLKTGARRTLKTLWDKEDTKKDPEENDLEIFFGDDDFRALLAD